MKDETLSDKIFNYQDIDIESISKANVKDFIQKLKEDNPQSLFDELVRDQDLDRDEIVEILCEHFNKKIDKLAGDDLIHSPHVNKTTPKTFASEDKPEDFSNLQSDETSGTHGSDNKSCAKSVTAEELAREFHDTYENFSIDNKWKTQAKCQVEFDDLPEKNKQTMIDTCQHILLWLESSHIPDCTKCGKPSYNHLTEDGRRSSRGIYCDDTKTKTFHSPSDTVGDAGIHNLRDSPTDNQNYTNQATKILINRHYKEYEAILNKRKQISSDNKSQNCANSEDVREDMKTPTKETLDSLKGSDNKSCKNKEVEK